MLNTHYDLKDPNTGENCTDFDTIQLNVLVSYGVLRPIGREDYPVCRGGFVRSRRDSC